jgi:ELWxxDGT repeat protein
MSLKSRYRGLKLLLLAAALFSEGAYAQSWAARSLTDNYPSRNNFTARRFRDCGGVMVFAGTSGSLSSAETWVSKGTAATTVPLASYNPETTIPLDPDEFTKVGSYVYFVASDSLNGRELWRAHLTTFATQLVKNIRPGSGSSSPHSLAECNGKLLFVCDSDNGVAIGDELWVSDGTSSGTQLLKDVIPGSGDSGIDGPITTVAGVAYFDANTTSGAGSHPWRSDGTAAGTYRLMDPGVGYGYPGAFTAFKGATYFLMKDSTSGSEYALWKTTGTTSSNVRIKTKIADRRDYMVATSTHLYFRGYSTTNGVELWKTDGTSGGTVLVKDVRTGTGSGMDSYYGSPSELIAVGDTIYFVGDDGVSGKQIWKSNGTATGTVPVQEVFNAAGQAAPKPTGLVSFSGRAFFRMTRDGYGTEWWSTNGSSIDATPAADVYPGATSGIYTYQYVYSGEQVVIGSNLYFVGKDADVGQELWRIGPPLSITTQPQPQLVAVGALARFTSGAASSAPVSYSWRKNGADIAGASSSSYSIPTSILSDAGNYQVIAESDDGAATSSVAKLGVVNTNVAPKSALAGGNVTLTVSATSPSGTVLKYQWKRGTTSLTNGPTPSGGSISGATSAALTVAKLSTAEVGSYTCVVTMDALTLTTQPAAVSIAVLPVVTTQPVSRLVKTGTAVTFSVVAGNTSSLTYQWKWNGSSISGATTASYTIRSAQTTQAGEYRCVLTNPGGSVNSAVAKLGVISENLTGTNVINILAGANLSMPSGLAAPTTAVVSHQWRKNSVAIPDGLTVSGSTVAGSQRNELSITNCQLGDAGFYSCTVGMDALSLTVGKFDLTVISKPIITTTTVPPAMVSAPFLWQITANGSPTGFRATGLPPGLVCNKASGLISGTPTKTGQYRVTITASNEVGTSLPMSYLLIIQQVQPGRMGTFTATISGNRAINGKLGGRLSMTVTSVGTYTGSITNGVSTSKLAGRALTSTNGDTKVILPLRRPGFMDLLLSVTLDSASRAVTGTLSDGVDSATVSGGMHDWNKSNPAASYAGDFNATDNFRSAYTDTIYPRGRGWLRVKISPLGTITGSGMNIEGLRYSFSSFLWVDGHFAYFVPIHSGRGSMVGQPQVSLGATTDASDDRLTAGTDGYAYFKMPSVKPNDRLFPAGFEVPDAQWGGSRWVAPPPGQVTFGWSAVPNNAKTYFTRGGLDTAAQYSAIDRMPFNILPSGAASFSLSGGNLCKVTFKLDPKTGMYSGTLRLQDPIAPGAALIHVRNLSYTGLMIPHANTGYGGLSVPQLPTGSETLSTSPIITGRADIIRF